jgi:hypothetical protein
MARSRSIPTQLFWDPAFSLLDGDTQIILLGLTLIADDEGRGLAQTRFLVRQFDKDAAVVEQALTTLTETGFLACYQIDNQRYYQHLHWQEWETLSKPTPSRYPAPPHNEASMQSEIPQENSKKPWEIPPEEEGEGKKNLKEEQKKEGEDEPVKLRIVPFPPATHTDDSTASLSSQQQIVECTNQIAQILRLDVSPALTRIVEEYRLDTTISLYGEADAAHEWIENPRRNRTGQTMTPAFFRRWLKREREEVLSRQAQRLQATGTTGMGSAYSSPHSDLHATNASPAPDPYQAYIERREREVLEQLSSSHEAVSEGSLS